MSVNTVRTGGVSARHTRLTPAGAAGLRVVSVDITADESVRHGLRTIREHHGAHVVSVVHLAAPGMRMEPSPDVPPGWSYHPSSWPQRAAIIALALVGFLFRAI